MFDGLGNTKITPRIIEIQRVIARHNALTVDDLKSGCRKRSLAWPRQIAAYLCRDMTRCSLPEIGRLFGGRDHTTILYAHRKVKREAETNADLRAALDHYRAEIRAEALARIEAENLTRIQPAPEPKGAQYVMRMKYRTILREPGRNAFTAEMAGVQ